MVDVVLKDIRGNDVHYPEVNIIQVNKVGGGVQNFGAFDPDSLTPEKLLVGETVGGVTGSLVVPDVLEDLPISLDFSSGNQTVTAPDGTVVKSASIQKPENLIPENIADGVNIAGIVGALSAGGGEVVASKGYSTGGTSTNRVITHNLGVIPDMVFVFAHTSPNSGHVSAAFGFSENGCKAVGMPATSTMSSGWIVAGKSAFSTANTLITGGSGVICRATETEFQLGDSAKAFTAGKAYQWFAIGGLT